MRGGLSAVLFPFMKAKHKPSKPRTKPSTAAKKGRRRGARFGKRVVRSGEKVKRRKASRRAGKQKAKGRTKGEVWRPRKRITDAELRAASGVILQAIEDVRTEYGISLEDLAGVAGVSRQCVGKARCLKNSPLFSTVLSEIYALNFDWCVLQFDRGGARGKGSAGDRGALLQLRMQMGRGRARVAPCHRNR